jgi:hypothetical protein
VVVNPLHCPGSGSGYYWRAGVSEEVVAPASVPTDPPQFLSKRCWCSSCPGHGSRGSPQAGNPMATMSGMKYDSGSEGRERAPPTGRR